ncbi:hypothetical protein BAUCODRAFT_80475 [Baudoinia panamericana UAMH 10762]|uniref:tRNA (adenine(58)-N(1))-methyltransferase catalytic subunit TRM61 n=1 Tax=Baudoinia panamericana (strain UAMH 10762) TaxID=717646 RepID=M2M3P3_BAUPA|nr:uncharacterized protein BAUCODRAFT_80475 [Baudoinia panamericana UAMH 10762]EMC91181.1 hypothetical protein BAUCODRAFT_80475 [Baudoinia panamericana UAMH 10762]
MEHENRVVAALEHGQPPLLSKTTTSNPFFHTSSATEEGSLTILHLRRDNLVPVTLRRTADDGYAEGAVTNTRFGSFPHSTLIGLEWGSQVRASRVDTGSRGRKGKAAKQQDASIQIDNRLPTPDPQHDISNGCHTAAEEIGQPTRSTAVDAGSGFIHLLPPTPEAWTASLDHRTQVVYTADYSYVLQRLRVRPGSRMIEAGAGSGSFTHAAARAVFSGFPEDSHVGELKQVGKVYSYEFNVSRVGTLREEISAHGMDEIVQLTFRDVCERGFLFPIGFDTTPHAEAIFLDLPKPWEALRHLTRSSTPSESALNPDVPVHLCTFSPCIEQVMATTAYLRKNGWTEIEMIEVQNHRIDVRREQVGLKNEGLRGVNASAATVEEAVARLREKGGPWRHIQSKAERLEKLRKEAEERKLYKEGNLVHRTEPEVKTHTSYLVFAVLPVDFTDGDEEACMQQWSVDDIMKVEKPPTNGVK